MRTQNSKFKRIIIRTMFCITCVLTVFISCDDDDHHHDDDCYPCLTMWQQDWNREYQADLWSQITPVVQNASLSSPVWGGYGQNEFTIVSSKTRASGLLSLPIVEASLAAGAVQDKLNKSLMQSL